MVRIGVPSAIAFNAGTAVWTGSATTVVLAHVSRRELRGEPASLTSGHHQPLGMIWRQAGQAVRL